MNFVKFVSYDLIISFASFIVDWASAAELSQPGNNVNLNTWAALFDCLQFTDAGSSGGSSGMCSRDLWAAFNSFYLSMFACLNLFAPVAAAAGKVDIEREIRDLHRDQPRVSFITLLTA